MNRNLRNALYAFAGAALLGATTCDYKVTGELGRAIFTDPEISPSIKVKKGEQRLLTPDELRKQALEGSVSNIRYDYPGIRRER